MANQGDLDIGIGGGSDPFATGAKGRGKIHVRIQQRNGRKCITTIQGLDADLDLGRIMKNMKKNCAWAPLGAARSRRWGLPPRFRGRPTALRARTCARPPPPVAWQRTRAGPGPSRFRSALPRARTPRSLL
jgi:hypothetical protein